MRKEERLKRRVREGCLWRGHTMTQFKREKCMDGRIVYNSHCVKCGREVQVNPHPASDEIEVGGEAVALNCE